MPSVFRTCAFALGLLFLVAPAVQAASPNEALTFASAGAQATSTLLGVFYADGRWRKCNDPSCRTATSDWGVDSATNALYLRWTATRDPQIRTAMEQIAAQAPAYPSCAPNGCSTWSDTPEWDAVAFMHEYEVLGDPQVLERAKAAYAYVQNSQRFALGACPSVRYQLPQPSPIHIKTLETEANAIKAALMLYSATQNRAYLDDALARYNAARTYFLDPQVPLYTVHIRDDGESCTQTPHRFFASVNGDMISNGIALRHATGERRFYDDAVATAQAVDSTLSDERGVFANVQGENDVEEPLVEAMLDLATREQLPFAREWILRNAAAALSARAADGTFARFFDGPSQARTSIWESNGGLALEIAAAALDPQAQAAGDDAWGSGRYVGAPVTMLPATITIAGSGVALIGTIGKVCEKSHVRVLIDGEETFDQTGLWQNDSMPGGDSVFFAWRWKTPGTHTITLLPANGADVGDGAVHLGVYVAE